MLGVVTPEQARSCDLLATATCLLL